MLQEIEVAAVKPGTAADELNWLQRAGADCPSAVAVGSSEMHSWGQPRRRSRSHSKQHACVRWGKAARLIANARPRRWIGYVALPRRTDQTMTTP